MPDQLLARRLHLLQARLYGILDLGYLPTARLYPVGEAMIRGGVDVLQLRAKNAAPDEVLALAQKLKPLFERQEALFIINDHADVAREVDADGLHIGQDDGAVAEARDRLHPDQLVGKSTHSLAQALAAAGPGGEGADYIGVGPLFATPTKPGAAAVGLDLIHQVRQRIDVPQFCIGGIKLENLREVIAAGATRAVVVSGILQAEDVTDYCLRLKSMLGPKGLLA